MFENLSDDELKSRIENCKKQGFTEAASAMQKEYEERRKQN